MADAQAVEANVALEVQKLRQIIDKAMKEVREMLGSIYSRALDPNKKQQEKLK